MAEESGNYHGELVYNCTPQHADSLWKGPTGRSEATALENAQSQKAYYDGLGNCSTGVPKAVLDELPPPE